MYRQIEFTREELFDKVWTTPVLRLAQEIGISDVALAKACRKANIPLPTRGHWANPEARRPRQPKLPKAPAHRPGAVQFSVLDVAQRPTPMSRAARDESRIPVPEQLEAPHPLVARTLKALKQAKPYDGRIRPTVSEALDIGVSPQQTDRALRILDALIKACDVRGFRWEVGKEGTRVLCNSEKIRIRLWETLTKQPIPPPLKTPGRMGRWQGGGECFYYPRYEWASTGRLSIQIEDRVDNHARRNWSGTAKIPLESKLHEIVAGLPVVADGIRLARERREAWRRNKEFRAVVRARFKLRGFDLPEHARFDPVFPVLQAAYSAKLGRPAGCEQRYLIELANTLFNSHKPALWVFSVMMSHYDRGALLLERGDRKAWSDKVRQYRQAWIDGDPTYVPSHRYTTLLTFLFPEAGAALRQSPAEYVSQKRYGATPSRS